MFGIRSLPPLAYRFYDLREIGPGSPVEKTRHRSSLLARTRLIYQLNRPVN
jgi:hypothetical protein